MAARDLDVREPHPAAEFAREIAVVARRWLRWHGTLRGEPRLVLEYHRFRDESKHRLRHPPHVDLRDRTANFMEGDDQIVEAKVIGRETAERRPDGGERHLHKLTHLG